MPLTSNDTVNPVLVIAEKSNFRLNKPKSQLSHVRSNELLPNTKVVELDKINNFRVQSFSSSNMKIRVNPEKQAGSVNMNSHLKLSNHRSIEFLPKRKVVGNLILNNFRVQNFSSFN